MTFQEWFNSAPHRAKYGSDHPAYLAAQEAWDAAHEACAKVADDHERQRCEAWAKVLTTGGEVPSTSLSAVAAAIRARGETK